jgi:hypothetical protein
LDSREPTDEDDDLDWICEAIGEDNRALHRERHVWDGLPKWFGPRRGLIPPPCWLRGPHHSEGHAEGLAISNEIFGLTSIQTGLKYVNARLIAIIHVEGPSGSPEKKEAMALLRQNHLDLASLTPGCGEDAIQPENVMQIDHVEIIHRMESTLNQARQRLARAEQYLMTLEQQWLTTDNTFKARACQFERAKWQYTFKQVIALLKSDRLKQIDYTTDVLGSCFPVADPPPIPERTRAPGAENSCPICQEDFPVPDEGQIVAAPIVTACCRQPFDFDCLWPCVVRKIDTNQTAACPLCRTAIHLDFLGEMLDVLIKDLDNV